MVDGELSPGGAVGKQRSLLCFVDGFTAPGAVFSGVSISSKGLPSLLPSPSAHLCMGHANLGGKGCLPPSAQSVCTPGVCCNASCSAPLPEPASGNVMGYVQQGSEGMQQPPKCNPGVWGNAPGKSSAAHGLFGGPLDSKLHGGMPNRAWQRPQVFALPILEDSSSFSIDDNSIRLDDGALADNLKRFEAALVGRLFGKRIPFVHLQSELKRRWEGYGAFRLVMVSLNSFVCFFDNGDARDGVLAGGPWLLAGQVIGLDRWSPSFSPSSMVGYSTPVWVRLPGLPLCCWDSVNIARITSPLGLPLWMDAATNQMERGVFARVCVKVDLSKPLKPGIWVHNAVGSFFQPVEYEGLPVTCFRCGLVGHKGAACSSATPSVGTQGTVNSRRDSSCSPVQEPIGKVKAMVHPLATSHLRPLDEAEHLAAPGSSSLDEAENQEARGLGPWMLVQRRRTSRQAQSFGNHQQPAKHAKWVAIGVHSAAHSSLPGRSQGLPKPSSRSGTISSPVAKGRPASSTSVEGSPHLQASHSPPPPSSLPPVQEGPVQPSFEVGDCLHIDDGQVTMKWDSTNLDMAQSGMNVQVQDHAGCMVQQEDLPLASTGLEAQPKAVTKDALAIDSKVVTTDALPPVVDEQPVFDGFKATAGCSSGRAARLGAVRRSALHRKGRQASPLLSSCSPDLVVGPCELPVPPLSLVVHSAHLGAIVPYCQRLYEDVLPPHEHEEAELLLLEGSLDPVEGGLVEGHRSLKVERMLKDLGPISSLPRKRRLIAVDPVGGDASPSLPP